MAVLPTRLLEIEFDAGVWTDVFADVVDITTRRGRNRELGAFETGSGFVTLRNESRKYDPEYAAGTYYGKLRPNRRIRFRATYSAVTYPVMVGYIDRITQSYDGPNGAVTVIAFSDLFKVLNRVELAPSVYAVEVAADVPVLWYRLDDAAGATGASNSGSLGHAYDGEWDTFPGWGPPGLGEAGLVVRDPGTAVRGHAFDLYAVNKLPAAFQLTDAQPFAIEAWLRPAAFTGFDNLFQQPGVDFGGGPISIKLQLTAGGKLAFVIWNTAGSAYAVETPSALTTGTKYHVVARHDSDRSMHVFLDGVDVGVADLGVPGVTTGTIAKAPGTSAAPNIGSATSSDIVVDELAIYNTGASVALSDARIAAHNSAGRTPWNGDLPGARAGRILDLAGVSAGDRSLDTGSTTLQNTSLGGSALAYLQKIADTELAEIFVTRDGKVRLLGRREGVTGTYLTSQATLADATPAAGEVAYRDVGFDVDDADIITRATVSRDGSVAITYQDAAAVTEFGLVDFTADGLLHDSDAYSSDYAQWIVNTHKTPTSRAGAVAVALPVDPANAYPKILALEIGDRVTLKRRPKVGAAITRDMRVEAVAHSTGGSRWATTLQLSPFDIAGADLPVWVWGTTKWGQQVWGL